MSQIHNRDSFLDNIAQKLGRARRTEPVAKPELKHTCHHDVMAGFTPDELKNVLCEYARTSLGSQAIETTKDKLTETLKAVCEGYCQPEGEDAATDPKETIISADPRLLSLIDINALETPEHCIHIWNTQLGYEPNIDVAERAKVGIVYAEQALAESGTMVLYSQPAQGRAISLLPEASVFVVPKSALVARLTQATRILHEKARNGERIPSCVNFISGPSSTADIELIKVVGVHGPVYATYIIIDDM